LEFVFGHTVHFTELVSCMAWGIAVIFEKPVSVTVVAGGRYAFSEGAHPPWCVRGFSRCLLPQRDQIKTKKDA
jgi:hypothetical protein